MTALCRRVSRALLAVRAELIWAGVTLYWYHHALALAPVFGTMTAANSVSDPVVV